MARRKNHEHKPNDKEQSKLFLAKAREIGADEEKSAADELLGRLAKSPCNHITLQKPNVEPSEPSSHLSKS
jgi:hypothetical protein